VDHHHRIAEPIIRISKSYFLASGLVARRNKFHKDDFIKTHIDPTITPAICTFSIKRKSRLSPARSYDPNTIFLTAFWTCCGDYFFSRFHSHGQHELTNIMPFC
jgi:hypothetical protein